MGVQVESGKGADHFYIKRRPDKEVLVGERLIAVWGHSQEAVDCCLREGRGRFRPCGSRFLFEFERDAVLFKLWFG